MYGAEFRASVDVRGEPMTSDGKRSPVCSLTIHQIVQEYSAVMELPNEFVIPVNAHHTSMCRFSYEKSQSYRLVEGAVQELVTNALEQTASGAS